MLRLILAFVIGLPAVASAQEIKYFYTRQECDSANRIFANVNRYNETPLFIAETGAIGIEGELYTGGSLFFVNQDTGTWSLVTMYQDGTACITAFGSKFEPYTD